MWISKEPMKTKEKLSDSEKNDVITQCQPLVELFKSQYITGNPDKRFDYLTQVSQLMFNC